MKKLLFLLFVLALLSGAGFIGGQTAQGKPYLVAVVLPGADPSAAGQFDPEIIGAWRSGAVGQPAIKLTLYADGTFYAEFQTSSLIYRQTKGYFSADAENFTFYDQEDRFIDGSNQVSSSQSNSYTFTLHVRVSEWKATDDQTHIISVDGNRLRYDNYTLERE